jgi:hypothetical protein
MSDTYSGQGPGPQGGGPGGMMMETVKNIVLAINNLATAVQNAWPRITGTFTLAAAATTTVTQPGVRATSVIVLTPTNAAAATLQGSAKALYVSAIVPGASFTVATANAVAAAGTETYSYSVFNPS